MNRRNFLVCTASSAGILVPATNALAHSLDAARLSASGDARTGVNSYAIIEDDFHGVEITMPAGKKRYPDPSKWAFTFWPGTKWPDSYGDGTNWLAGNAECQA